MTGEELRLARQAKALTQKKLGLLLGYSENSAERVVQLWEHDKQPIPARLWRSASKILGVPIDKFIP